MKLWVYVVSTRNVSSFIMKMINNSLCFYVKKFLESNRPHILEPTPLIAHRVW